MLIENFTDNEKIILKCNTLETYIFDWIIILFFNFLSLLSIKAIIICINQVHFLGCIISLFSILFTIYFSIYIFIEVNKKITLTKEGYKVELFFIKKFYYWNELQTKVCEVFKKYKLTGSHRSNVKRNVIFCNERITKSKTQEPRDYLFWNLNLFSFFSILLIDEETLNEKNYSVNYFRMDEHLFKRKMKEWNIEIEEDL